MLATYQQDAHIGVLTLNDPDKKNAMGRDMAQAFAAAVAEAKASTARVVVVRGAGGAFSGGGDLAMLEWLGTIDGPRAEAFMHQFYGAFLCVSELKVPTIAVLEGAAVGAGLCMAMACDLRVVASGCKLGLNFSQLGIHAGMGATYLAPLRLGREHAADVLFTGRRFNGDEGAKMGLATRLVKDGAAEVEAMAWAAEIAKASPTAVQAMKRSLQLDQAALSRALEREAAAQAISYTTSDFKEGVLAAKQRRAAQF